MCMVKAGCRLPILGEKHTISGRAVSTGLGCLAVRVCQANGGSLTRVVGSLCRNW